MHGDFHWRPRRVGVTMVIIHLTTPLDIAGDHIESLEMEEPRGGDVRALGDPVTYVTNGVSVSPVYDNEVIAQYLVRLCKVAPSTINKLSVKDFLEARTALLSFFAPQG